MQKKICRICRKYAKNKDPICKKYRKNMQKYAKNMQFM